MKKVENVGWGGEDENMKLVFLTKHWCWFICSHSVTWFYWL